jgi:hypothetical protein
MIILDSNINSKNKLVAVFMGGYLISDLKHEVPHGFKSEIVIQDWKEPMGMPNWVSLDLGHFDYHSSWDWLMPVIRKINGMGKEYQFTIFKTYVSCTVERGGKFYKDFSFSHAEYITEEQSDITAAYNLVVKFIEWYNQINNEIQDENKEST